MNGFEILKRRMEASGTSYREERIINSRKTLEVDNQNDPSYSDTVFFWKPGISPHKGQQIHPRFYKRTYSSASGFTQKFQTIIDEQLMVGDTIYDESDSTYWICTESYNMDSISWNGKLTKCNNLWKSQRPDGSVLEYPCQDLNSTQYNSGETSGKVMTLGSAQHMLTLPCDDDTVLFDTPLRIFLDKNPIKPTPYVITQNDTTMYNYGKGLCKVTVTQDVKKNDDRPDLGICDYKEPVTLPLPNEDNESSVLCRINYSGTPTIKIGGRAKVFTGLFLDIEGNEVSLAYKWNVEIPESIKQYIVIKEEALSLSLSALNNTDLLGEVITLSFFDEENTHSNSIDVTIVSGV